MVYTEQQGILGKVSRPDIEIVDVADTTLPLLLPCFNCSHPFDAIWYQMDDCS